jgi:hypothetical protein
MNSRLHIAERPDGSLAPLREAVGKSERSRDEDEEGGEAEHGAKRGGRTRRKRKRMVDA